MMINNGHAPAQHLHALLMCTRRVWALSGNFHCLPQFALNPDKMRVLVAVFMLTLSLGYSFRVEDVFEPAEDFVDTDRQGGSLSDNIPAVFAVSFGASLLANVLFRGGGDASANVPSQGIDICHARQDVSYINAFCNVYGPTDTH